MSDAIKLAIEALEAITMDAASVGAGENAISDIARIKAEAALAALRAQPTITVPDNMQDWKGMDSAIAFHLIERHADNWSDVGKMMSEWLEANRAHPAKPLHKHEWFRTGSMEPGQCRCISCGVWSNEQPAQPDHISDSKKSTIEPGFYWSGELSERLGEVQPADIGLTKDRRDSAEATLIGLGYKWNGGEQWKPPLGPHSTPSECQTEAEKKAYSFGWWNAMENVRTQTSATPREASDFQKWSVLAYRALDDAGR